MRRTPGEFVHPRTQTNNLPHRGRGTAAAVDEGGTQNRYGENPGEYVPAKAHLKGELSAQLTEGSGLAKGQALRRRRKYRAPQISRPAFRLRRSFSKEKPDPSDPAIAGPAPLPGEPRMYVFLGREPKKPSPAGEGWGLRLFRYTNSPGFSCPASLYRPSSVRASPCQLPQGEAFGGTYTPKGKPLVARTVTILL